MAVLRAICIAFSTYSAIPMPRVEWSGQGRRYAICALPLVGIIIGILLLVWYRICALLNIGQALFSAVASALPLMISGGIHMDGFCDTVDALSSHQSKERKLEILKDPHTGAFAVIYAIVYMLICFGAYTELYDMRCISVICTGFVLSRSLCVLTVLTTPNARRGGMLSALTEDMARGLIWGITAVFLLGAMACMAALFPAAGCPSILLCWCWFFLYRAMTLREFGGVTGDTSGFFLQISEALILLGCVGGSAVLS